MQSVLQIRNTLQVPHTYYVLKEQQNNNYYEIVNKREYQFQLAKTYISMNSYDHTRDSKYSKQLYVDRNIGRL